MSRKFVPDQLGLFRPDSDWVAPRELPDLRGRSIVALDTENRDDGIARQRGPGWALGPAGYICGIAYAADENTFGYIPIRHPETECFDPDRVMEWVSDIHRTAGRVVYFNSPYDLGWLGSYGVPNPEVLEDAAAAAVMLDEQQRSYSLDACCARAGIPGKDKTLLAEAARAYGGDPNKPAGAIYKMPGKYVGPYAEADALATLRLFKDQEPKLRAQGVWDAYRLEMELVPVVVAMRRRGIRVNLDRAAEVRDALRLRVQHLLDYASRNLSLRRKVTMEDLRSPQSLAQIFTAEGLNFPRTSKTGQGSFSADWMEKSEHWLPRLVVEARRFEDSASKFVENFIMSYAHRGRLHAEVHQFRTDDGGTRSQRFSYSNPALQQMPGIEEGPDDKPLPEGDEPWEFYGGIGGAIRGLFEPEQGCYWGAFDYSQQEPRMTVHFAAACKIRGAEEAVRRYQENPRADYHRMVADMTGMARKPAKILNLAMTYGKGKHATAAELNLPLSEAEELIEQYHSRLTFIRPLDELCKRMASQRGYIRLIDGARMHYNQWEGGWMDSDERAAALRAGYRLDPCSLEEAKERMKDAGHPWNRTRLRRADTRKALNNLVQGSAARQTKRAMLECYKAGHLPLLQMHDELDTNVDCEKTVNEVSEIMCTAIPLAVPVVVDAEMGRTWGEAKYSWAEVVEKYGDPRVPANSR